MLSLEEPRDNCWELALRSGLLDPRHRSNGLLRVQRRWPGPDGGGRPNVSLVGLSLPTMVSLGGVLLWLF